MQVQSFFHEQTHTFSYIVSDPQTKHCAIIDPVLDYDPASGQLNTQAADSLLSFIAEAQLHVAHILETHCHADHLTAAAYLKAKTGAPIGIGHQIEVIMEYWQRVFQPVTQAPFHPSSFDNLFRDGDVFAVGKLHFKVLETPGHTPGCLTYVVEDAAFVGDVLLLPDLGTARADFPGGNAGVLFDSIQRILSLANDTRVFTCHDYPPVGRQLGNHATVAQHLDHNVLVAKGTSKAEFIEKRQTRDQGKSAPRLLLPALQLNLRAGRLAPTTQVGQHFFHIPLSFVQPSLQAALEP